MELQNFTHIGLTINYRRHIIFLLVMEFYLITKALEEVEPLLQKKLFQAFAKLKKGLQKTLYLGNLEAKRDWGHAKDYVVAMWKMLQKKTPKDYVIATGTQLTVKEFVNLVLKELKINYSWKGKGIYTKCYISGTKYNCKYRQKLF